MAEIRNVHVNSYRGEGCVQCSDETKVPARYHVREYATEQNLGSEWARTGFGRFDVVSIDHGGLIPMPLGDAGQMFLEMEDGRRLQVLPTSGGLNGVTRWTATGGILPPA